MCVEGLDRLRVVERSANSAAPRHADHDRHPVRAVRAVADARRLVDDLLERWRAEVGELHFGDREQTSDRRADRDADDR